MLQANGEAVSASTASTISDPGHRQEADSQPAEEPQSLAVSRPKRRQATRTAYKEDDSDGEWEADWLDTEDPKVYIRFAHSWPAIVWGLRLAHEAMVLLMQHILSHKLG